MNQQQVKELKYFQLLAILAYVTGFTILIVDTLTPFQKGLIVLLCINTYFYYEVFLIRWYHEKYIQK